MRIKNNDLRALNNALISLGNYQGSIKERWKISKMAKPFSDAVRLLDIEIQNLVDSKGILDEKSGQITLKTTHHDYIELMNLDIDVECQKLTLEELELLMPTTQELIGLAPIIDGGE